MDRLNELVSQRSAEIAAALAAAETELKGLRERETELVEVIDRARRLLGSAPLPGELTLHEAISVVLEEGKNDWMTVRDIADEINSRSLYTKKDGSPVEPNQIHARTNNYWQVFEKNGPLVRLGQGSPPETQGGRSKYDALRERLSGEQGDSVTLALEEIDALVGGLPKSAVEHSAWWANESSGSHVQARSWMNAGWRVDGFDIRAGWIRFRRAIGRGRG